jgi:hypothetical protein
MTLDAPKASLPSLATTPMPVKAIPEQLVVNGCQAEATVQDFQKTGFGGFIKAYEYNRGEGKRPGWIIGKLVRDARKFPGRIKSTYEKKIRVQLIDPVNNVFAVQPWPGTVDRVTINEF